MIDLTKTKKKARLPQPPPPQQQQQEKKPKERLVLLPEQPLQCYVPDDVWYLIVDLIDVRDAGAVLAIMQINTQLALRLARRLKLWLLDLFALPDKGVYGPVMYVQGDVNHNTRAALQHFVPSTGWRFNERFGDDGMARVLGNCYRAVVATSPHARDCIVPLSNVTYLVHLACLEQRLLYINNKRGLYRGERCGKRAMLTNDRLGDLFYKPRRTDGTVAKMQYLCVRRMPRLATVKSMPHGKAAPHHCMAYCDTMDDREKGHLYKELLLTNDDPATRLTVTYAVLRHTLRLHSPHAHSLVRNTVWRRTEQDTQYTHLMMEPDGQREYYVCRAPWSEKYKKRALQYHRFMGNFAHGTMVSVMAIIDTYAAQALVTTKQVLKL